MKEYCYDLSSDKIKRFNRAFPVYTSVEGFHNALHRLGLKAGDKVVVHSSLASLGTFDGGAEGVCRALMQYITSNGMGAALDFALQLVELLKGAEASESLADAVMA